MAKASSPVRLESDLMKAASATGNMMHRSASEQIEYWASIGRSVAKNISEESMLALSAGLATIKIEPIKGKPVNPDDVFNTLSAKRSSGDLSKIVANSQTTTKYQASKTHYGKLERIDPDGTITIGQYSMGKFTPEEK